jgi:hypothetical protein
MARYAFKKLARMFLYVTVFILSLLAGTALSSILLKATDL